MPCARRPVCEHVFVTSVGDRGAVILHADLDAFYASVEQRDDPALAGRPVIVGGGVVLAASYEARAHGVRTAMNARQALRLCPAAVVVAPRLDAYSEASRAVFALFEQTTPLVEPLSIDEAFLDVGGLRRIAGSPRAIAEGLRRRVADEVGLAITVGVARTKFLAKVASGVAKPDGLLVVEPDEELAFLHALPLRRLWGVGAVTAATLNARGLTTVGELACLEASTLVSLLGPAAGRHLHALAHNEDPRPVQGGRRRRSMGAQHALGRGPHDGDEVDRVLIELVERIGRRLRQAGRVGRTVELRLRFDDFSRATRSHSWPQATAHTGTILATGRALLADAAPRIARDGLTLIGVSVANLSDSDAVQLALPFDAAATDVLDTTLDEVRDRFGTAAVTRGSLVGRRALPTAPMLPEP